MKTKILNVLFLAVVLTACNKEAARAINGFSATQTTTGNPEFSGYYFPGSLPLFYEIPQGAVNNPEPVASVPLEGELGRVINALSHNRKAILIGYDPGEVLQSEVARYMRGGSADSTRYYIELKTDGFVITKL